MLRGCGLVSQPQPPPLLAPLMGVAVRVAVGVPLLVVAVGVPPFTVEVGVAGAEVTVPVRVIVGVAVGVVPPGVCVGV